MWYPSEKELLSNGVVTAATAGDDLALSGFVPPASKQSLDDQLQQVRMFRALKKADPMTYQRALDAMLKAFQGGHSAEELRQSTMPLIGPVVLKNVPFSSDEALLRFGKWMVAELAVLRSARDDTC